MYNKNSKLAILSAAIFEIIIIIAARKKLFLSLTAAFCIIIPFIITYMSNRKKIRLPDSFQPVIVVFMFLALYLGEIRDFYDKIWWWDLLLHAIFGAYAVITAIYISEDIFMKNPKITKKQYALFKSLFAFCFSITLGTLWEIFEFSGDYIINSKMVKGGIEDTSTDLIIKIIAALIYSIIFYFKNTRNEYNHVNK